MSTYTAILVLISLDFDLVSWHAMLFFIKYQMFGPGWVSQLVGALSHTPPVLAPPRQLESSLPRLPVSAPPTGLDECLFFISLVSDLLAV